MIDRRHFASGEGRESRFSFSCLHWDHEPTPNPSQEGNFRAADECLLPSWGGRGWVGSWKGRESLQARREVGDGTRGLRGKKPQRTSICMISDAPTPSLSTAFNRSPVFTGCQ